MRGLFVSATGTGAGKTWVSRGLARLASKSGLKVAAIKPVETGVAPDPVDALQLGHAAHRPELAFVPGFVRRKLAASPRAATLAGEPAVDRAELLDTIHEIALGSDLLLVEGAGGLFVPLDHDATIADLALAIGLPVLVVAPNRLGVLSDVIATVRCATQLELRVAALALTPAARDASTESNAAILTEHLGLPVHVVGPARDDDDDLARAVSDAGLESLLGLGRPTAPE